MTLTGKQNEALARLVWKYTPADPAQMIPRRWERFDRVTQSVEVKQICPNMATPEAMVELWDMVKARGWHLQIDEDAETLTIDVGGGVTFTGGDYGDCMMLATAKALLALIEGGYLTEMEKD